MTPNTLRSFYFRRWFASGMTLLVVLAACTDRKEHPQAEQLDLAQQILLSSSMRQEPVPGWTTDVAQLGLPAGTVVRPVGNIGDRGIFIGITGEGWWLLGLDVTNGQRLFGPVRLGPAGDATDFNCYVNGPPIVLCVRQGPDPHVPSTAWVVDTESGKLAYEGPTDLRVALTQDQPRLEQIGDYAIAAVSGKGVHGVGPRGELTWFVAGDGNLPTQFTKPDRDIRPSTLAVQGTGKIANVVFSVVDGRVVKPQMPQDVQLGRAVVYPGGFGYEYNPANDVNTERVAFFDDTGKKLSEPASDGKLESSSFDVPMLTTKSKRIVLTLDGKQLLELPASDPPADARLIGTRYFVAADSDHRAWQQFDLRTGDAGKTCEGNSLGYQYIASDGEVAVALTGETPAQGIDLATCDTLWSMPGSAPNQAKEVWKVNTTLVQRTDDRLFSLVAPH